MVIRVLDITHAADTGAQGALLGKVLLRALSAGDSVEISFSGIATATSSFVNASFVPLLETMTFSDIKKRVRVTESSAQINHMIKLCVERSALQTA